MRFGVKKTVVPIAAASLLCLVAGPSLAAAQWAAPAPTSALTVPNAQLIQPDELNRILHARGVEKPLILQVGSHMMFAQAHIPGAEYAGPGSQSEGVEQLRGRVASLPRATFIVLYCGCCPWNRCPNVGPAYQLLNGMGFTHVKVLYLADNFGDDWVNKEFPVESGR
ncbi:MAG: rhodanese-like domain-containing protein [Terracidiphilus sp.]